MARPKKSAKEEKATVKMESAFWSLLKTKGYAYITVSGIVRESRVNRNSFYYHYNYSGICFPHNHLGRGRKRGCYNCSSTC